METEGKDKMLRVLSIYGKLEKGRVINKAEEAEQYGVSEKSIGRDIEDIRNYLEKSFQEGATLKRVKYDREQKGYRIEEVQESMLSNSEILAVCKILLDSRAFTKKEMQSMLSKLIDCCVPKSNQKLVKELIGNEEFHYIQPRHNTVFIDKMWELGQAIYNHNYVEIDYQRNKDKALVHRRLKPAAIMFSEFYFYVTAFIDDDELKKGFETPDDPFPTIYRIDRIKNLTVSGDRFRVTYRDRFEEGEFRKRIQFMYGGKLQKVKFEYSGENIEAVLDRLPTAQVVKEEDGVYTVTAEVFGKGIEMWLRSQGVRVR